MFKRIPPEFRPLLIFGCVSVSLVMGVVVASVLPINHVAPIRPPECPHPDDKEPVKAVKTPFDTWPVEAPKMAWSICDHD